MADKTDEPVRVVDRRINFDEEDTTPKSAPNAPRSRRKQLERERRRNLAEAARRVPPEIANPATLSPAQRAMMAGGPQGNLASQATSTQVVAVAKVVKGVVVPMIAGITDKLQHQIGINAQAIDALAEASDVKFKESVEIGNNAQGLIMAAIRGLIRCGVLSYPDVVDNYNLFMKLRTDDACQVFLKGADADEVIEAERQAKKKEGGDAQESTGSGGEDHQAEPPQPEQGGLPELRADGSSEEQDVGEQEGGGG